MSLDPKAREAMEVAERTQVSFDPEKAMEYFFAAGMAYGAEQQRARDIVICDEHLEYVDWSELREALESDALANQSNREPGV